MAIPWRKVCTILSTKLDAGSAEIQDKEEYEEDFQMANWKPPIGRRRTSNGKLPSRKDMDASVSFNMTPYGRMLSIFNAKFKDLMEI